METTYDIFWTPFQTIQAYCTKHNINWNIAIRKNCYFVKFHFGNKNKHYVAIQSMMESLFDGSYICLLKTKRTMYCVPTSTL